MILPVDFSFGRYWVQTEHSITVTWIIRTAMVISDLKECNANWGENPHGRRLHLLRFCLCCRTMA